MKKKPLVLESYPTAGGWFGEYGGKFVPETLMASISELEEAYLEARDDQGFQKQLSDYLKNYVGRPTPLTFAERLTDLFQGAKIYLKREDLAHTGAHKINNALGQILLAKRMGKKRIVAETGAGQHGVATATVAALFGLECIVYMGVVDMARQAANVHRMNLLGAKVVGVESGSRTLKDAVSEAMRDWVTNIKNTHYVLGSVLGPHPYPMMVRDFQKIIGEEARLQILERENELPRELIACVGGGSNGIGLFYPFLNDETVMMTGVEAGGRSLATSQHAARFQTGSKGILQGTQTYILQTDTGQIHDTHSISAGLDYAAVGPEHALLRDLQRVNYTYVTDTEALEAFHMLSKYEGILPALESSHALAYAFKVASKRAKSDILLVSLSGRGDKDLETVVGKNVKQI